MARHASAAFLAAGRPYRTLAKEYPKGTGVDERASGAKELKRYLGEGVPEREAIDRVLGKEGRAHRSPRRSTRRNPSLPRLGLLGWGAVAAGGYLLYKTVKGG